MSVLTTFQGRAQAFVGDYASTWAREEFSPYSQDQVKFLRTVLTCLQDPYLAWTSHQVEQVCGYCSRLFRLVQVPTPVLPAYVVNLLRETEPVYWSQLLGLPEDSPALVAYLTTLLQNSGGGRFGQDIPVSLSGGKTLGKYTNGQTIPSAGKTAEEVFRLVGIEDVYPIYAPASVSLSQGLPVDGEVGESITLPLTAAYSQGDAGSLAALSIFRDGVRLGSVGTTSPQTRTLTFSRTLAGTSFQAKATYGAGPLKPVPPTNTPDDRPSQVRNPNATQAGEVDLPSNTLTLVGHAKVFFGNAGSIPTNSSQVRALPQNQLTSQGNQLTLITGTTNRYFPVVLAPGQTILSVVDLDNQQANITAAYQAQSPLPVADAGGTLTSRPFYLFTANSPYLTSARHLITLSS